MAAADFLKFPILSIDPDELSQRHSITPAKLIFRPLLPNGLIEEVSFHLTIGGIEYNVGHARSGLQMINPGYRDFLFICMYQDGLSSFISGADEKTINQSVGIIGSSETPACITLNPLSSIHMINICQNRVNRAILAHTGRISKKNVRFVSEFAIDGGPGLLIKMIAETLFQGLVASDFLTRSELACVSLVEALIEIILGGLPHNFSYLYEKTAIVAAPARVKRAVDFINANAALPITVEDMAAAANLNVRTLYASFRRYYETTPRIFLHRMRLQAVRHELQDSKVELPLKEIAQKWGFVHMGRFAGQYRKAFGELPRETRALKATAKISGALD